MNYKVLYRKYRPCDFDNIIGQDYIIKTLKNSVINGKISHAYIFSGPRGTGKTSTAKVFAKAINCLNNTDGSPCGKCDFCLNFNENPDIIEIDAASNNGVDEIRNLIDNIKLTPSNGKYKVYIIDEVHMMTTSAFNALLLTLEEPPAHAIFILATTNIENVPITILSRCQRFDFQKISVDDITDSLINICKKEKIKADDEALREIAYLSDGGMRDALSILDQLSKNSGKITLDLVEKQINTVSKKSIDDLIESLENNDIDKFLDIINNCKVRAVDYKHFVKKIIDGLSTRAKELKKSNLIKKLSYSDYKNLIINLSDTLIKTNINVDSYIILEMLFLEYFNQQDNISNEKIMESKKEKVIEDNKIDTIRIRINNCFVDAKKECLEKYKKLFEDYNNSSSNNGKIKSILIDSKVVAASDKYLILTIGTDHMVENANDMLDKIEKEISKVIGEKLKMVFLTNDEWEKEKEKYIQNIKKGIKYSFIEEKDNNKEKENINDVFSSSKVEII